MSEREQFEAWAREFRIGDQPIYDLTRDGDGLYEDDDLASMWNGWAARASLPPPPAAVAAETPARTGATAAAEPLAWAVTVRGVRVSVHHTEREACDDAIARCKSGVVGVVALPLYANPGAEVGR